MVSDEVINNCLSSKDDTYGLTPLHYAVMKGNVEAVLDLLAYSDIDIEVHENR